MGEAAPKDGSMEDILASIRKIINGQSEEPALEPEPARRAEPSQETPGTAAHAPVSEGTAERPTTPKNPSDADVSKSGSLAGLAESVQRGSSFADSGTQAPRHGGGGLAALKQSLSLPTETEVERDEATGTDAPKAGSLADLQAKLARGAVSPATPSENVEDGPAVKSELAHQEVLPGNLLESASADDHATMAEQEKEEPQGMSLKDLAAKLNSKAGNDQLPDADRSKDPDDRFDRPASEAIGQPDNKAAPEDIDQEGERGSLASIAAMAARGDVSDHQSTLTDSGQESDGGMAETVAPPPRKSLSEIAFEQTGEPQGANSIDALKRDDRPPTAPMEKTQAASEGAPEAETHRPVTSGTEAAVDIEEQATSADHVRQTSMVDASDGAPADDLAAEVADEGLAQSEAAFKEALVSPETSNAVAASVARLRSAIANKEAAKVEALLKPMLKEWLDDHLPEMVERIVQVEIERIASEG